MARTSASGLLQAVRVDPAILMPDPKADLRRFRVAATSQLGTKRGVGRGSFIDSILAAIDGFYQTVLQGIRPWVAKAPQLPKPGAALAAAGIDTTVLPKERAPDELLDDEQHEVAADLRDVVAAGTESLGDASKSAEVDADVPLVSWDDQQDDIRDERLAGVSAEAARPSDDRPNSTVPPVADATPDSTAG